MRFFLDSISSKTYWQYVLFSKTGAESILAIFGAFWLFVETLDFFHIYDQGRYPPYAFIILLILSVCISIMFRRPLKSICINFPGKDFTIEVMIGDLFEVSGAIVISTNTVFESDVAGGRIAPESLQGQFTARYFTGDQNSLLNKISDELQRIGGSLPYPYGTTIPITTHGKTFYFTAMAELNSQGNASTTLENVRMALEGLWNYVKNAGELQELAVPLIGTGRGRLALPRKKMIACIAESFVSASEQARFTNKLVIVIRSEDASKFKINLYDVKDHLIHILHS